MVEILVSLLIITLGIVGFGMAIPLGKNSLEIMGEERIALLLAKQMMEEIQTKAYEDPNQTPLFGLEGGEASPRVNFDDIDDYDNWDQSPPQYPDGNSVTIQNNTDFRRTVVVENVADNDYSAPRTDGTTSSKRITVTVSSPPSFEDVVIKWVATREGMDLLY
ncbi:MAG: hypothetical protein V2A69_02400 [Pseudomonadota bacterium]